MSGPQPFEMPHSVSFSASEVFQIAIELEDRGYRFYELAAQACRTSAGRDLFARLALMERDHRMVFEALRDQYKTAGGAGLSRPQMQAVVGALLSSIQQDLLQRFASKYDTGEILREAVGFEKDTIVFLLAMRGMIDSAADRQRIDIIIQEELGHVLQLGSEMAMASA